MSSCLIYINPFHRLCVWLPSPYHAVISRLPNKQYYLFVYFLKFSKNLSPKVITDTLSITIYYVFSVCHSFGAVYTSQKIFSPQFMLHTHRHNTGKKKLMLPIYREFSDPLNRRNMLFQRSHRHRPIWTITFKMTCSSIIS